MQKENLSLIVSLNRVGSELTPEEVKTNQKLRMVNPDKQSALLCNLLPVALDMYLCSLEFSKPIATRFEPSWKMFVKMGTFPQIGLKKFPHITKNIWNTTIFQQFWLDKKQVFFPMARDFSLTQLLILIKAMMVRKTLSCPRFTSTKSISGGPIAKSSVRKLKLPKRPGNRWKNNSHQIFGENTGGIFEALKGSQ